MLYILIKTQNTLFNEEYVQKNSTEFDIFFEDNRLCLQNDYIKNILLKEEHCKIIEGGYLENEDKIIFQPFDLSSSMKSIILAYYTNLKLNGSHIGDKFYKYIIEIAKTKDIYLHLGYAPRIEDKYEKEFKGFILNYPKPKYFNNYTEFFNNYIDIQSEEGQYV